MLSPGGCCGRGNWTEWLDSAAVRSHRRDRSESQICGRAACVRRTHAASQEGSVIEWNWRRGGCLEIIKKINQGQNRWVGPQLVVPSA